MLEFQFHYRGNAMTLFMTAVQTDNKVLTSIDIDASANDVWTTLLDFDNYTHWNPFITNIDGKAIEGEELKVTISLPFKQSMDFNLRVKSVTDGSEMIWLGQTLKPNILDGEHFLRVESLDDNRTRFSQGEKFSGIMLNLALPLIKGSVLANFNKMNQALKNKLEA